MILTKLSNKFLIFKVLFGFTLFRIEKNNRVIKILILFILFYRNLRVLSNLLKSIREQFSIFILVVLTVVRMAILSEVSFEKKIYNVGWNRFAKHFNIISNNSAFSFAFFSSIK